MKFLYSKFICIASLLLCCSIVKAQENAFNTCAQPFTERFDEFEFKDFKEVEERIALFASKLNNDEQAEGRIFVYAGRKTKINQAENLTKQISDLLNQTLKMPIRKLWATNGGFRETATIEMVLKPLACSEYLLATPSLNIEEVEFEGFTAPKDIIKKSLDETMSSITERTEAICSPAAKAVGLAAGSANVYVLLNETGEVAFAKGIAGHPLLRVAAANTVQKWKFKPTQVKNKQIKVIGEVWVEFPSCREPVEPN